MRALLANLGPRGMVGRIYIKGPLDTASLHTQYISSAGLVVSGKKIFFIVFPIISRLYG